MSKLEAAKVGLVEGLVNGTGEFSEDNLIRGRILGLELAKSIIHEAFLESTDDSAESEAE